MRRVSFLLFVLLMFDVTVLNAQEDFETRFKYGFKAGLNMASLNGKHNNLHVNQYTVIEPSSRYGLVLGGVLSMEFSKQFTTQLELNYSNRGVVYDAEDYVQTWQMDYLEVPVLFKSVFTMQNRYPASIFIGPVLAYNINAEWSDEILDEYVHEDQKLNEINAFDLAGALGGSMEFEAFGGMLGLDARYVYGLMTIKDGISVQNGVISFSIYFLFNDSDRYYY